MAIIENKLAELNWLSLDYNNLVVSHNLSSHHKHADPIKTVYHLI